MRIHYDWEFLEDGHTIAPISVGMVSGDGGELYLINRDAPWGRIIAHPWLMDNVVPHLPFRLSNGGQVRLELDDTHPDARAVVSRESMAIHVLDFMNVAARRDAGRRPELWAYYGAYDHVCLSWLFGPMIARPPVMPMVTFDIVQAAVAAGIDLERLEKLGDATARHNALADARWNRVAHDWIEREAVR